MFGGRKQKQTVDFDRVDTVLGPGTEVKGTVKAEGTLRIDGAVDGEIEINGDLIVSESAHLKANIHGRHATVAGEITGDVELSGRLEITPTGKIYGQIKVASLTVTEGGFLSAYCIMLDAEESANDSARKKHQRIPTQKEKQSKGK